MGGCINNDKAKTTTPLVTFPTLRKKRGSSLTSPANQYRGDAGDGVYGLSCSSEKARMSNHFPMSWQKKRVFHSYLTTLSVCLIWSLNPRPSRKAVRFSTTWISQVRFFFLSYNSFISNLPNKYWAKLNLGKPREKKTLSIQVLNSWLYVWVITRGIRYQIKKFHKVIFLLQMII